MCDTDSMAIVATEHGGTIQYTDHTGTHRTIQYTDHTGAYRTIPALTQKNVEVNLGQLYQSQAPDLGHLGRALA